MAAGDKPPCHCCCHPLTTYSYNPPNPVVEAAERRRYALLQAATQIYCMGVGEQIDDWSPRIAAQEAEAMLAEIEKRETEPK